MEIESNFGNLVEVEMGKKLYEGILLPSPESGTFLLKLENGYNIGFNKKEIVKLKVLKKIEEKKKEFEFPKFAGKGSIALVLLGGTISARLNPGKGGVDFVETPEDLFKVYPQLFQEADVKKIVVPFMKASENMDFKDWQKVAKVVSDLVNDKSISGVLVLQGTDALHYTASALSFFLRDLGKPVVLTFSQRSIDRGSSDARLNLLCSAKVAISNFSGVVVVGHANSDDEFCFGIPGTKVRKLHSSRRDAFKPVNSEPFFKIYPERIEKLSDHSLRNEKKFCVVDNKFEDKVSLLKFYPGQDPSILEYYLEKGYKGIIIEMLGLGHVATSGAVKSWIKKLKEVQKKGLIICAAAQTIYGRLDPLVYVPGRELLETGIIYLEDMLSETAYVKLGWVLGHKDWANSKEMVKSKMLENFSGEINKRILE
ncbi:Glu-tRNA(Gln) amidotransferase GatDE subunit D [Candidatus Pacearchaeota archaeon CG10_big_fil_rev_8_21_14_0_10_32_42]|nr:MAG: Glu-tRNA(Gln) amidotransferase GatDE subunit D [Candidatus Pacearchaeota archaeon CG10_big_fil_rev_8_21_14_0_10_32_42]